MFRYAGGHDPSKNDSLLYCQIRVYIYIYGGQTPRDTKRRETKL